MDSLQPPRYRSFKASDNSSPDNPDKELNHEPSHKNP